MNNALPIVNVDKVIQLLSSAYISLIEKDLPFKKLPAMMLWGPPGVGKSQAIRQIADNIHEKTGKKVVVTDVRLLLFNPVDLRGIPTANEEKTLAVWLKPKIFQMDEGKETVNILFLDEISAAPPSVQAAAYQITLDRMVGEHQLPENCIVMAAGNRITDKSVAYNMPKALSNRLCHFEIEGDADAWHDWAISKRIHPFVIGYLDYNPTDLMRFDPSGTSLAFPTPRSWEMVSNILRGTTEDVEIVLPMIEGCIGRDSAHRFSVWAKLYQSMPEIGPLFDSGKGEVPEASELQIVLRSAMTDYAGEYLEQSKIDNAIEYGCQLPLSWRKEFLHDLSKVPGVLPLLKNNEVYQEAVRNGLR